MYSYLTYHRAKKFMHKGEVKHEWQSVAVLSRPMLTHAACRLRLCSATSRGPSWAS